MNHVIEVTVTIDSTYQYDKVTSIESEAYFTIFDERYKKGKKEAWALKNQYAAQQNPFIEIKIDGKYYTAIYSEATQDPFGDLEKTLKKIDRIKDTLNS